MIVYRHEWLTLGTCWYCQRCGEQNRNTSPPQMGCPYPATTKPTTTEASAIWPEHLSELTKVKHDGR